MEFASQISISLQQEPYSPVPAFGLLADAFHPTELACDAVRTVFQPEVLKRDPQRKLLSRDPEWSCKRSTYNTVNELNVLRTLSITVPSSIVGTCLVSGPSSYSSVSIHLGEVKSAVQSAREVGNIHIECELLAQQLQHLVLSGTPSCHQVCSGPDIGLGTLGNEVKREGVTTGRDAVCRGIGSSVQSTAGSASDTIRADG
jgi:hypothetical protein